MSDDLKKLQTKQLANVTRKLHSGKMLRAGKEAMLAKARNDSMLTDADASLAHCGKN